MPGSKLVLTLAGTSLVSIVACGRHAQPAPPAPASAGVDPPAAPAGEASPCGDVRCTQYDSALEAFQAATASAPEVIAVGEAHAQKGSTVPSAAQRFTGEILPALAGRASDLLVELMMPPTGCTDAAAEVRQKQAPATSRQAETNQNEYVTMGDRARALGIVPDMLRPSCADLDGVRDAGDEALDASLRLIARLCGAQGARLVDRDAKSDADRNKAVVIYSGLLHNDLAPPPERAAWSYAPALDARVGGRLVAIDLVVPEFIAADDPTWKSLPWVASYEGARERLGARVTLLQTRERSYVLVFAESHS